MTEEIKFVLQDADWLANLSLALVNEEMIENVVPKRGIGGLIGQSSAGKSFVGLDAAIAIASGKSEWFGLKVTTHKVVYICLEGQAGFGRRIAAYRKHHGNPDLSNLKIITTRFDLLDTVCRYELISILAENHRGCLLIIDTLAQACPGIEENSSKDMGRVISALNEIQQCLDCFVLVVHHQGKNADQGARGHSSLLAAFDIEITVSRDKSNNRSFRVTKNKDGEELPQQSFYLQSVDLGEINGKAIESKVVVHSTETFKQPRKNPSGKNQKIVYDIAGELLKESKSFGKGNAPSYMPCLQQHEIVEACRGRLPVSDPKRVSERVIEALKGMIADGIFEMQEDWIWLK